MRVHRALALAGVASRRAAEAPGRRGPGDGQRRDRHGRPAGRAGATALVVDGDSVRGAEPLRAYLLQQGRAGWSRRRATRRGGPTVLDDLPDAVRLYPVGRLDIDTTGALLRHQRRRDGRPAHAPELEGAQDLRGADARPGLGRRRCGACATGWSWRTA